MNGPCKKATKRRDLQETSTWTSSLSFPRGAKKYVSKYQFQNEFENTGPRVQKEDGHNDDDE
jgi:hypothetical protein